MVGWLKVNSNSQDLFSLQTKVETQGTKLYTMCFMQIKGIKVEVSRDAIWTPQGSKPLQHKFYMDESSFPPYPKYFFVDIHRYGQNAW